MLTLEMPLPCSPPTAGSWCWAGGDAGHGTPKQPRAHGPAQLRAPELCPDVSHRCFLSGLCCGRIIWAQVSLLFSLQKAGGSPSKLTTRSLQVTLAEWEEVTGERRATHVRGGMSLCETLPSELPDLGIVSGKENKIWVVAFEPNVSFRHYCEVSSPVSSSASC